MTAHVIILPRHRPPIRRKKLTASELAAQRARDRASPVSPIARPVPRRSESTSSLDSVSSESDDARSGCEGITYWGPIIQRSPL